MSASHTPEPWSFGKYSGVVDAEGADIAANGFGAVCGAGDRRDQARANTRRIVACVNACACISTETLERRGMIPVSAIEQQRDALLAAAKAAEAVFARQKWRDDSTDPEAVALRLLRVAIAGAEGAK